MIHASHDGAGLDGDDPQPGEPVERAAGRHREHHHRAVELRAHEVVDDRAAGAAHDARLVAGAGVEREREPEVLRDRPERGRTRRRCTGAGGTCAGRNSARKPCSATRLASSIAPSMSSIGTMPTGSRRGSSNTSAAQLLYARHSCTLELGVFGREAGLQRERREDHLGADAVARLVAQAVVGIEVADDRDLALGRGHQLAAAAGSR